MNAAAAETAAVLLPVAGDFFDVFAAETVVFGFAVVGSDVTAVVVSPSSVGGSSSGISWNITSQ